MKKCKVCQKYLSADNFYNNRAKCKSCYCKQTIKYSKENIDKIRPRQTEYHRNRYQSNPIVREKEKSRSALNRAVHKGLVLRENCWCGNTAEAHHHKGYLKALDVVWLCKKHHMEVHYG